MWLTPTMGVRGALQTWVQDSAVGEVFDACMLCVVAIKAATKSRLW